MGPSEKLKLELRSSRVVAVVGGVTGIGREIVSQLTEAGCECFATSSRPNAEGASFCVDFGDIHSIEAFVDAVKDRVSCVVISGVFIGINDEVESCMKINVTGPLHLASLLPEHVRVVFLSTSNARLEEYLPAIAKYDNNDVPSLIATYLNVWENHSWFQEGWGVNTYMVSKCFLNLAVWKSSRKWCCVCPGRCSTRLNHYAKDAMSPSEGARAPVDVVLRDQGGKFWNQHGSQQSHPW